MLKHYLISGLDKIYPLTNKFRSYLTDEAKFLIKKIRKNDMLWLPGMDANQVIYLHSGSCKLYWLDDDNQEHTFMFLIAGDFLTLLDDMCIGKKLNEICVKTLEDAEIISIGNKAMDEIGENFPESLKHKGELENRIRKLRDRHILMLLKKERERYLYFVKEFHYVYRMQLPEKELCQFMSICRKTLSIGKTNWVLKDRRR